MRQLIIATAILALAGCDPPPQQELEDEIAVDVQSRPTNFTTSRLSAQTTWTISSMPGITLSGQFSKTLRSNTDVTCTPPAGYVILEWDGVISYSGNTATVAPNTPMVVAVLAQLAGG